MLLEETLSQAGQKNKTKQKKNTKKYWYKIYFSNTWYGWEYEKKTSGNYILKQGGLNKEIQLNLCKIFFILIFNESI